MNYQDLFENTFVLSLQHRFDRRFHVEKELKNQAIDFSFFDAVNGLEIKNESPLLPGEYGIKLSHIQIIEQAIKNDLKSIFIFEDDIVFSDDFSAKLEANLPLVPEDCELLYLGGAHRVHLSLLPGTNIARTIGTFTTHAMWIHSSMFDRAIASIKNHIDQQLDNCYVILQQQIPSFTFYPNIVWQKDDYSDIQSKFINYDWLKP